MILDPDDAAMRTHACWPEHEVLRALSSLGDDCWEALDGDPQFLLDIGQAQPAGVYRITARLTGNACAPSLYMDFGDGWSEATRLDLEPRPGGQGWSIFTSLPAFAGKARFDPASAPGQFHFRGIRIERLSDAEALLLLLERVASQGRTPVSGLLRETRCVAAARGIRSACEWLMSLDQGSAVANEPMSYHDWTLRFDTLSPDRIDALHASVSGLARRPLMSLVLPVAGLSEERLRDCVEAVLDQIYPDWELILADEAGAGTAASRLIEGYAVAYSRILKIPPAANGDDARTLNDALSAATGVVIVFLDQDVLLRPHTLLAFAFTMIRHPGARLVYADEDRHDEAGRRVDPFFKPDWNPDLFLSNDFLNPLCAYEASLVRAVGGMRTSFEHAGLRDLALRCVAGLGDDEIVHVPLVLCHRRNGGHGAGLQADAVAVGRQVLAEHLGGASVGIEVAEVPGGYRVRRAIAQPVPKVSLIIPTRDRLDLLRRAVGSILSLTTYPDFEVVIVDNQSAEQATLDYLSSLETEPKVRVLSFDAPFNYSAINNFAVGEVDGQLVGLINNDIEVISPDWLEEMIGHALRPEVGAVGAMLYYPDDTIQHAGVVMGLGGVAGHPYSREPRGTAGQRDRARLVQNMSAVTGACLLVRRAVYLEVGGLDPKLKIAFNDVDFCLKLRKAGYRNVWTPFAELYHHESASRGAEDTPEKQARFVSEVEYMLEHWSDGIRHDPVYHPNLSVRHGNALQLASEPRCSLSVWIQQVVGRNNETSP